MSSKCIAGILTVLVLFCAAVSADPVTICRAHEAKAVIVVDADAKEPVKHAAEELAIFLKQITSAGYEILNEANPDQQRLIVGPGAVNKAHPNLQTAELGTDGIVIKTIGSDILIFGGQPRGTLYAVYTFLEDYLGCRWWTSKVSTIPHQCTVTLNDIDVQYIPKLEYRESFWTDAFDGDWSVRNKCNGNSCRLDEKRGGKHTYEGFVHTFNSLIPPDTYFKTHPEWFSMINGKRSVDRTQLCLTNEDMKAELIKNLRARLKANPAATIASVSQNDWYGNCQCPKCSEIEKKEESPSGLMIQFVNDVAKDIEKDFPNVAISTLAYQYTRQPPKFVKPRHNVIVRLCSIECSFSVPLAHERNKKFRDDIVGWSKICNRLYIWDYVTNFRHYVLPHPNIRVLGPNIRFFTDHSVKGIFEQGAYTSFGAEMAELRAWVLAKMLWNPDADPQNLIDEFIDGYYGPAGVHIRQYLNMTHDAVEKSGDHLGCFSTFQAKFLTFDLLNKGWLKLKEAEASVVNSPELTNRVKLAQLPVLYAIMVQWDKMQQQAKDSSTPWPLDDSIEKVYAGFRKVAAANNITRLNEWNEGFAPLDQTVEKFKKK